MTWGLALASLSQRPLRSVLSALGSAEAGVFAVAVTAPVGLLSGLLPAAPASRIPIAAAVARE